jgi:hypothetical protein
MLRPLYVKFDEIFKLCFVVNFNISGVIFYSRLLR